MQWNTIPKNKPQKRIYRLGTRFKEHLLGDTGKGADSQMKTMEYSLSRLGLIMTETNVISLPIGVSLWIVSKEMTR